MLVRNMETGAIYHKLDAVGALENGYARKYLDHERAKSGAIGMAFDAESEYFHLMSDDVFVLDDDGELVEMTKEDSSKYKELSIDHLIEMMYDIYQFAGALEDIDAKSLDIILDAAERLERHNE